MRQRVYQGCVNGQCRVKEMGQPDAVGFGNKAERGPVAIKAPGPPLLDQVKPLFIAAVDQFIGNPAVGCFVGQLQGLGTIPLDIDDCDQAVRQESLYSGIGFQVFESHHDPPLRISSYKTAGFKKSHHDIA